MFFEEIDWRDTPMGELALRRRFDRILDAEVFEVKLGDEFLMSSAFTVAEKELARLALTAVATGHISVLVGGLGLGYTTAAALEDPRVESVVVVEALPAVIDWHRRDLLPDTAGLASDPRLTLVQHDFFELSRGEDGFHVLGQDRFDAILLDVDHTPRHLLHPSHASFYSRNGLQSVRRSLNPGGVFALWSDDPPDEDFLADLSAVFPASAAHVVAFPNPLTGSSSSNTVYVSAAKAQEAP